MSQHNWQQLDLQMRKYSSRLRDEFGFGANESNNFATAVSEDLKNLSDEAKKAIKDSSPVVIKDRLDELVAFQAWMDASQPIQNIPAVARARVITQNYVCFVYLGESCFKILKQQLPAGVATKRACQFLIDNPVRAFRNAIAHANWRYKKDFSGIEFWARKGSEKDEPLIQWTVNQTDLGFWQALTRSVAYIAFTSLSD